MSKRGPDYQKQQAKRSLWDNDGFRVAHKYRERGRGRGRDKELIHAELAAIRDDDDEERAYQYEKELERAWLCHAYNICDTCYPQEESNG